MDKSSYYPAKNVVEKMPQGYALPIDRVVWIDIFLKIFSTEAAAEPTHNSLKKCTDPKYQNTTKQSHRTSSVASTSKM